MDLSTAKRKLIAELAEARHLGIIQTEPAEIISFPRTRKLSYSYDDLVTMLIDQALMCTREGCSSMMFDCEYTQHETDESRMRHMDPPRIDSCQYLVIEEGRKVPVLWNQTNSPNLFATLASDFMRAGFDFTFPFIFSRNKLMNQISWCSPDELEEIDEMLSIPGGYDAFVQGVPISDIIA